MRLLSVIICISLLHSCTVDNIDYIVSSCNCERTITENGIAKEGSPYVTPRLPGGKCEIPEDIIDSSLGMVVITRFHDCELIQ